MVLFQIAIDGYTNSRISANVPCQFYGHYKVKFLNYAMTWNTQPNVLLRLNSQALIGNYAGGQIILGSNPTQYVVFNTSRYEFEIDLNGYVDLDITQINETVPANFRNAYFSFDFEKLN
jgi:hypothetical protein